MSQPGQGVKFPNRLAVSVWPNMNGSYTGWTKKFPLTDNENEYLSLAEHEHLAKQRENKARAEAFDSVLEQASRIYQQEMDSDPSDYFFTRSAIKAARKQAGKESGE